MADLNFVPNSEQPKKPKSEGLDEGSNQKWTNPEVDNNNQTKKFDVLSFFKSLLGKKDEGADEKKRDKMIIAEQQNNVKKEKTAKKEDVNNKGEKDSTDKNVNHKEKLSSIDTVKNKVGLGGDKWKAANIIKTNLIKGEVTTFFNWKKNLIKLGISLGWTFVLLGFVYIGLVVKEKNLEKEGFDIAQDIKLLDVTIESYEKDKVKIDLFKAKVKLVSDLLKDHIYWTNIFDFFEKNTLPSILYTNTSINATPDGVFRLSAKTNSYENMVNQIKVFQSLDIVEEVDYSGGTRIINEIEDEKTGKITRSVEVTFDIDITLDKKIFNK